MWYREVKSPQEAPVFSSEGGSDVWGGGSCDKG